MAEPAARVLQGLSPGARAEAEALGIVGEGSERPEGVAPLAGHRLIPRRAVHAPDVLNEAYDYAVPSSFSRGVRAELSGASLILLSGTASVDEQGRTVHAGDFTAQCLRTLRNLTRLLASERASWHDVLRTTCYLRDIERDYETFNRIRTEFLRFAGVDPLPASTAVAAHICRPDLLIEIEAMALVPRE